MRKWSIVAVAGTILVLAAGVYFGLAASLPLRSGEAAVAGLDAAVAIELDAHAIPKIRASSFEDVLRAQGFMHAQERFFQMDLLRRSAAGELAELFGERALAFDRSQRRFQFRKRAAALLGALPPRHVAWLHAYVQGVNAGLATLRARPPEYWLAGARPAPWTAEDSLLAVFSFYTMLSNNEAYERGQAVMHAVLPPAVYEFLTPSTSRFDAPLVHDASDPTGGYEPSPIPGADLFDPSRAVPTVPAPATWIDPPLLGPASNQWAVGAARSAHGGAILANDPHLELRVPSTFYRCELHWGDRVARGVSIAGLPGVLLGANHSIAWGATVSNADQSDWVVIEIDPEDSNRYRTPDGSEPFTVAIEEIEIRGRATPERLEVRSTRWGPVLDRDWLDRPLALHAAWLEQGGVNLEILELVFATDADEALDVLARWAGPSLNWMLADVAGDAAWIVNGPLPQRVGFDGARAESWADGSRGWSGLLERPALREPADGALFTANNRTLPRDAAERLSRMWMRPLRAQRIAELLAAKATFAERDFLAMQLDTRAQGYDLVREIVLDVVSDDVGADATLRRARAHVLAWNGHADADQPGFRILHVYYRALIERLLAPLLAPARAADARFVYRWPLADEPLRRLLEARPAHLLPPEHSTWNDWLERILLDALQSIEADGARPGIDTPWGAVNALDVAHPLGPLPLVGRWPRLPRVPLPGSTVSLRVAAPSYGAVIRMSVAPSRPEDGVLEMSGGQSGHFLSANFSDLQRDWATGAPTPFLAGATVSTIRLEPE